MPIYEYECEKCKKQFEVLQRVSDPPMAVCSECGGPVRKMISSPSGLVFKGSGFYITDYAKKNGKSDAAAPSKGEGKSTSGETGGSAPKKDPPPKTDSSSSK